MATEVLVVENGLVAEGFDSAAPAKWCSPKFAGFQICASANTDNGSIILTVELVTPRRSFSKRFSFNDNVCFTWKPQAWVSLTACISKFKVDPEEICFTLSAKVCAVGACSPSFGYEFCVPLPNSHFNRLLADEEEDEQKIMQHLLFSYMMQGNEKACSCH